MSGDWHGANRWVCPACDREFARERQGHTCVPGCTVDQCFANRPPVQRAIYDAMMIHVTTLGPVHVDAVQIGVFLKNDRKFAEARPKARSLSLALCLQRPIDHPRITRKVRPSADRAWHFLKLVNLDEVDDELRAWLTEAYDAAIE